MQNRLSFEDSPYLQQHKNNLFDWYPWCDEAFEKAKSENKPIFISIGYCSCHWSHVMEHEVFENKTIATFMNTHFVCIKVDRDERPDIDKHFQALHQLLNRRIGGWPLSIFCTPHNKPFYAATYIPPYARDRMIGFEELCSVILKKISENDEKLFENADEIVQHLKSSSIPTQATVLDLKIVSLFIQQADYNFDTQNGGFSSSPKFPHISTLETLLYIERLNGDARARTMLMQTLDNMALGGMYDHIDGGFFRYSTDPAWLIPHFGKTGYDNALLCALYTNAALTYKNDFYDSISKDIANFMMNSMMENNLFYSACYADSDRNAKDYFLFSYDDILLALKESGINETDLEKAASLVGVSSEGKTIIRLKSYEKPEWFAPFRHALQTQRNKRTYPLIDKRVITSWNAMMIRGLFILGKLDHAYTDIAIQSLNTLLKTMVEGNRLYHTTLINKKPKIEAFLEDYAYLSAALLEAYSATMDDIYLLEAQKHVNKALEKYYDRGGWYFSHGDFSTPAELDDSTYPSSLAVMVESLLTLGSTLDEKYRHFAFKTLEYYSLKLMRNPIHYPKLAEQIIRYLTPA